MNPSLCFLTAAWLAGQSGEAPRPMPQSQYQTVAPQAQPETAPAWRWGGERRGLLSKLGQKIGGMFGRGRPEDAAQPPAVAGDPGRASALPRPAVQTSQAAPQAAIQPQDAEAAAHAARAAQAAKDGTAEVKQKYMQKIGNETDYSWVTGQLFKVHSGRGPLWVVRYATVDTIDRYGGSVVLTGSTDMASFREGDLVSVRGEVLNDGRPGRQLGGAQYRVSRIDLIERAE